jgi:sodium-dependent phosphate cotransporter
MVGVLATTLVQSSSVTTSLIVAMVAAPENPLPLANAVPMVMGANVGTTVTNTIVSLAHMGRPDEFRRAFAVATCHDFFNFMAVVIFLPLEIATGFLQHLAESLTALFSGVGGVKYDSPIKGAIKAGVTPLQKLSSIVSESSQVQAVLLIVLCGVLIYVALFLLVKTMRSMLKSKVEGAVTGVLDRSALLAMIIGVIVTAMVQSSSITTSLLVPLAGAGIVTLTQAFPVTIGANIGTTVTALLASLAVTGENAAAGVTIALVHLFFNLSATAVIYPVGRIRNVPLAAARKLADVAVSNRWAALAYVVSLFYLLPMVLAFLDR